VTVHLISVGLSLRDALHDPRKAFATDRDRLDREEGIAAAMPLAVLDEKQTGDEVSTWLTAALSAPGDPGYDATVATRIADQCRAMSPGLWPPGISAELDTFHRVAGAGVPLSHDDIAVLISSDTAPGLVAALWNAVALTGGDLARVGFLPDSDAHPGDVRGRALIVRVRGMDAATERGFVTAMRGLGLLGRHLIHRGETREGEAVRCYLSGGFKAAIPYLIGLAEGLRSLPETGPVAAYVLHESTASAPILLPLRRIAPERVRKELSSLRWDAPTATEPPSDFLDGYAYEKTPDGWRLTAFGAGLQALFGIAPPGLLR